MEKKQEVTKRDYIVIFEPIKICGCGYKYERNIINNIQVNVYAEDFEKAIYTAWQMVNVNDSEYEVVDVRACSLRRPVIND